MVPETAGHSLEELDKIFEGSWFMAFRSKAGTRATVIEGRQDRYVNQRSRIPADQGDANKTQARCGKRRADCRHADQSCVV